MQNNETKIFEGAVNSLYPNIKGTENYKYYNKECETFRIENKNIIVEFDDMLRSRVFGVFNEEEILVGDYSYSHYIIIDGKKAMGFKPKYIEYWSINDEFGSGQKYVIIGRNSIIEQRIIVKVYKEFPYSAFLNVTYTNIGGKKIWIDGWLNNNYMIKSNYNSESNNEVLFWSYQSGSYEERPDWILPLKKGFMQENFMGMNSSDYGGGTPISDVWREDIGIAVGHIEKSPKLVSLPVSVDDHGNGVLGVSYNKRISLDKGECINTFETFVTVHKGDYFNPLSEYRKIMEAEGIVFEPIVCEAYMPTWCAWGYERDFRVEQIYGALPMVKKLGIEWVCLDDGWQAEEGDYELDREKFPRGDLDMKEFVDRVHSLGLKAQLWWIPLAVDPKSKLYKDYPEYIILDKEGKPQFISWWDNYYMCPSYEKVKEHTKDALKKILIDWGFDGLKIDGQHLNAAPPCYNKAHNHDYPEKSYEEMSEFFKMVYDFTREIKHDAVVMFCPCGTSYSFFTMPFYNEPVASDPESSWQIRTKGKAFKALMGPYTAFHGDHVELSDKGDDFASTIGVGGVVDTKFTWPKGSGPISIVDPNANYDLDEEKEEIWLKWLNLYNNKMLSKGEYLGGLYTIGYDYPETHVIKKDEKMYYAFFAEDWDGDIELRGLENGEYSIFDYENNISLGSISTKSTKIKVSFRDHMLIEVCRVK